jgi:hypothetical protein
MNCIKNVITNILGLIFWSLAVKDATSLEPSISFISSLVIIGGALFLFKNETLIDLIKKAINKKIE